MFARNVMKAITMLCILPLCCCFAQKTSIEASAIKNNIAYVQAGAGIVADSVPEKEYLESVNKAKALIEAITKGEKTNGSTHSFTQNRQAPYKEAVFPGHRI